MASGGGFRQMQGAMVLESQNDYARKGFGPGFFSRLKQLATGSTRRLVTNCEDVSDFDVSDSANFNAVNETSVKLTGSNAIELVDVGSTKGTFVTLDEEHRPLLEDWSWANWLVLWAYDDTALRLAGELTCQIRNNGVWSDELLVPVNITASAWECKCIDISDLDRSCVDGFRFVNQRGSGSSEKVYIDKIEVTDLIAGVGGATQAPAVGPVTGPCAVFPVASGETLYPGRFVNLEAGEVTAGVQNDTDIVGVVLQDIPFDSLVAADTTPKEVLVAIAGAKVQLRNDGTGCSAGDRVMIASGNVTVADGSTNLSKYVARALGTGTAYEDTWYDIQLDGAVT